MDSKEYKERLLSDFDNYIQREALKKNLEKGGTSFSLPTWEGIKSAGLTTASTALNVGSSLLANARANYDIQSKEREEMLKKPITDETALKDFKFTSPLAKQIAEYSGKGEQYLSSKSEAIEKNPAFKKEFNTVMTDKGEVDFSKLKSGNVLLGELSTAIGSMFPTIAAAIITRGKSLPASYAAAATTGVALERGSAIQSFEKSIAEQRGVDVKDLSLEDKKRVNLASTTYGLIAGALEGVFPAKFAGSALGKKAQATIIKRILINAPLKALEGMAIEGSTEALQQFSQNVIGKISELAPDGKLSDGVIDSAIAGALGGGFFGGPSGLVQGTEVPIMPVTGENKQEKQVVEPTAPKVEPVLKQETTKLPENVSEKRLTTIVNGAKEIAPEIVTKLPNALNSVITKEDIASMSDQEASMIGLVLSEAVSVPGFKVETIKQNIKTLSDSGVKIPVPKPITEVKPVTTTVETPKPVVETPVAPKTIVEKPKPVAPETNPLIQEAGKYNSAEDFKKSVNGIAEKKSKFILDNGGYMNNFDEQKFVSTLSKQEQNLFNAGKNLPRETQLTDIYNQSKGLQEATKTEIIKKAIKARENRLKKEGYITPEKKSLKLKYPSNEKVFKREVANEKAGKQETVRPGVMMKLYEGKKLTKSVLEKEKIFIRKEELLKLMKLSPEFKDGSVLTMKDGLLRFEGKTHSFGIKQAALGLPDPALGFPEIKEGTKITIHEADLKNKEGGQIPELTLENISDKKLDKIINEFESFKLVKKTLAETNPNIRAALQIQIFRKIATKLGSNFDTLGQYSSKENLISLSRKTNKKEFISVLKHEIRHHAFKMMPQSERNQVINWYSNLDTKEIVKIYGSQERFNDYANRYKNNVEMLADETANQSFDLKENKNKIYGFYQKTLEKIALIFNKIFKKTSARVRVQNLYDDVFSQLGGEKFKLNPARIKEMIAEGKKLGTVETLGETVESKGISNISKTENTKEKLVTEKGSLKYARVIEKAWEKTTGEKLPKPIIEMLSRKEETWFRSAMGTSFTEGKGFERMKWQERKVEERIKIAEKNKKLRKELNEKFKNKALEVADIKSQAVSYVENSLPKELRGDYLKRIKNAKTKNNLAKICDSVDVRSNSYEQRALVKSMQKILDKLHLLPIEIQKDIIRITDQIELKKHTSSFMDRLRNNKEAYDSLSEDMKNNTSIEVLRELKILDRTPFYELSTQKLMEVNNKLQQLSIIGRTEMKIKKEVKEMNKEQKLKELEEGTQNMDVVAAREAYNEHLRKYGLTKKGKAILKYKEAREWLRTLDWKNIGMDRFLRIIDKGAEDLSGKTATLIVNPVNDTVDIAHDKIDRFKNIYNNLVQELRTDILNKILEENGETQIPVEDVLNPDPKKRKNLGQKLKEFRYFIKVLKRQEKISKDIGVMAFAEQADIKDKLILNNKYTAEEIEEIVARVKADPVQMKLYQFMRKEMDKIHPELSKVYEKMTNETLNFIPNFFPNRTDYSLTKDVNEEDITFRASVNFQSLKHRMKGGNQLLDLSSLKNFQNYMESSIYYINTAETIRQANEIIESKEYKKIAGENAQEFLRKWLLVTAKRGGHIARPKTFEKILDYFRTNIGPAYLGLRPTTVARQAMASANGAALIGGENQVIGTKMMAEKKWRDFLFEKSVQLRNRAGGDILWQELANTEIMHKLQDMSMKGVQLMDLGPAGATWLGAYYKKMKELGKNPNDMEIDMDVLRYADLQVRMAHGTAQFNYAPQILFGENRSYMRAFHMFETFVLSQWSQIERDLPAAWRRNKKEGAKRAAWLLLNFVGQAGITAGHAFILSSLFGGDDDEKTFKDYLANELMQAIPYVNKITSTIKYGKTPILVDSFFADALQDFVWTFKGKKDTTKAKHAIKLMASLLELKGIPAKYSSEILIKMIEK